MILSIDIGGTAVKMGLVDEGGEVHARHEASVCFDGYRTPILTTVMREAEAFLRRENAQVAGIGVSATGQVDDRAGVVIGTNGKIPGYEGSPIKEEMESRFHLPVWVLNDANAAALGECFAGAARGRRHVLMLTLGTGVGGGVVLGDRLLTGYTGAASELGHMVIVENGEQCTCGRRGCFEAYSSATALIRDTKRAMAAQPESLLHTIAEENGGVDGRTAFLAKARGDEAGARVVADYIEHLACALTNLVNIFFPEVLALSGGVANQGEALLAPLRERVRARSFGSRYAASHTRIERCTLGYRAGVIGAAMLARP